MYFQESLPLNGVFPEGLHFRCFFGSIPLGTVIHAESGLFKRGNGSSFLCDSEAQIQALQVGAGVNCVTSTLARLSIRNNFGNKRMLGATK